MRKLEDSLGMRSRHVSRSRPTVTVSTDTHVSTTETMIHIEVPGFFWVRRERRLRRNARNDLK